MPVVDVDAIQFDTSGWESCPETPENRRVWENACGDILTLRYNPGAPKFPSLFRPQALRDYYQQQVTLAGGCILSVDLLHVKGVAIGKLVFKTPQPKARWGYIGTLALPYQDFSYTLQIQSMERRGDRERQKHVWNWLQESHVDDGVDCMELWFSRPGLSEFTEVHPCLADDVRWDTDFPQHPLSRLRSELYRLIPSLEFSRDVKNSQPHRS